MNIQRKKGEIVIDDGVISFKEAVRIAHDYDYRETEGIAGRTVVHGVKIFLLPGVYVVAEFETEEEAKSFSRKLTRFILGD